MEGRTKICKVCNCEKTKEHRKSYQAAYYKKNKEKILIRHTIWNNIHKEEILKKEKAQRKKRKNEFKARRPLYYERNKKCDVRTYNNCWHRHKRKTDIKFRLNRNISRAISGSLRENKNGRHWENVVNYTIKDLKKHLEKQFVNGMTWKNYGEWHIDHKIPMSVFNFTKPEHEDFKKCWALDNLQPMWAKDNFAKHTKITKHFQPSLLL